MKINPLVYAIGAWFAYRYYQSHKYDSSATVVGGAPSSILPVAPTTPPPFFTTIPATHIPPAHTQW